jgi:hypothetical protein
VAFPSCSCNGVATSGANASTFAASIDGAAKYSGVAEHGSSGGAVFKVGGGVVGAASSDVSGIVLGDCGVSGAGRASGDGTAASCSGGGRDADTLQCGGAKNLDEWRGREC